MLPVLDKPDFDLGIDILLSSTVILRFFESISSTSRLDISNFHFANSQQHTVLLTTSNAIS